MNQHASQAEHEAHPQRWIGLGILLLAGFMNLIDVTIVNVALPQLQANLGATSSQIEWVAAAYVLAFALGLLPFGRLGDAIGRKRMFLIGVASFTLFSVLCGLAPGMRTLILARVLQGLAGAMMMPQVLALAQVMFPPHERGFAFSFFGLTAGLASVAGPLVGGLLIGADLWGLDWRPIFLVNLPVGIFAVVAGFMLIPDLPGNADLKIDIGGVLLAGTSILLLAFPLVEGHSYGWPAWAFAMLCAALVGFVAFFFYERRRAGHGSSELLPTSLMTNAGFMFGILTVLIFFSGVAGFFLVFAVFLQTGFGMTPLQSGLTTIPFPIGVLAASLVASRFAGRWPRLRLAGGALVLFAGMFVLRLDIGKTVDVVDHWQLVLPLAMSGFGLGTTIAAMFQSVLSSVPGRDAGAGAGAVQSFQQIGGALGIAITGQIFFSVLNSRFAADVSPHPAFVQALQDALLYNLAAFAAVAILGLCIRQPAAGSWSRQSVSSKPGEQPPIPVEM